MNVYTTMVSLFFAMLITNMVIGDEKMKKKSDVFKIRNVADGGRQRGVGEII